MPIPPVNGQLLNAGDKVTAILNGDPTVMISLTGTFAGAFVVVEAVPFGQTQFIPIADVNVQSGAVQTAAAGPIGPLSNTGPGGGYVLKVDAGGYSQIQVRRTDTTGGAITGVIATLPFPTTPSGNTIQSVTGTVNIGQVGQQPKIASVPVTLATDQFAPVVPPTSPATAPEITAGAPVYPAGARGLQPQGSAPVPVLDQQVVMLLLQVVSLLEEQRRLLEIIA